MLACTVCSTLHTLLSSSLCRLVEASLQADRLGTIQVYSRLSFALPTLSLSLLCPVFLPALILCALERALSFKLYVSPSVRAFKFLMQHTYKHTDETNR